MKRASFAELEDDSKKLKISKDKPNKSIVNTFDHDHYKGSLQNQISQVRDKKIDSFIKDTFCDSDIVNKNVGKANDVKPAGTDCMDTLKAIKTTLVQNVPNVTAVAFDASSGPVVERAQNIAVISSGKIQPAVTHAPDVSKPPVSQQSDEKRKQIDSVPPVDDRQHQQSSKANAPKGQPAQKAPPQTVEYCPDYPRIATWNVKDWAKKPDKIDEMLNSLDIEIAGIQDLFGMAKLPATTEHYTWHYSCENKERVCAILLRRKSLLIKEFVSTPISQNAISVQVALHGSCLPDVSKLYPNENNRNGLSQLRNLQRNVNDAVKQMRKTQCSLKSAPKVLFYPSGSETDDASKNKIPTSGDIRKFYFLLNFVCVRVPGEDDAKFYKELFDGLYEMQSTFPGYHLLLVGDFNCQLSSKGLSSWEKDLNLIGGRLPNEPLSAEGVMFRLLIHTILLKVSTSFWNGRFGAVRTAQSSHILTNDAYACILTSFADLWPPEQIDSGHFTGPPITIASFVPLLGIGFGATRQDGYKALKEILSVNLKYVDSVAKEKAAANRLIDDHCDACMAIRKRFSMDECYENMLIFTPIVGKEPLYATGDSSNVGEELQRDEDLPIVLPRPNTSPQLIDSLMSDIINGADTFTNDSINLKKLQVQKLILANLKIESAHYGYVIDRLENMTAAERDAIGICGSNAEEIVAHLEVAAPREFEELWCYIVNLLNNIKHPLCAPDGKERGRLIIRSLLRRLLDVQPAIISRLVANATANEYKLLRIGKWSTVEELKNRLGDATNEFDEDIKAKTRVYVPSAHSGDSVAMLSQRESLSQNEDASTASLVIEVDPLRELLEVKENFEESKLTTLVAFYQRIAHALENKMDPNKRKWRVLKNIRKTLNNLISNCKESSCVSWKQVKLILSTVLNQLGEVEGLFIESREKDRLIAIINDLDSLRLANPKQFLSSSRKARNDSDGWATTDDEEEVIPTEEPKEKINLIRHDFVADISSRLKSLQELEAFNQTSVVLKRVTSDLSKLVTEVLCAFDTGFENPDDEEEMRNILHVASKNISKNINEMTSIDSVLSGN